jgi:predicted HAD superfamily Cof-like phosphohydrolase
MENPIKRIIKFNQQAGLVDKGYDDFLESSFQIEEALEGFHQDHLDHLGFMLEIDDDRSPERIAKRIALAAVVGTGGPYSHDVPIPDVDRLDKACDAVVFAVGSMAKLGLNAQQITQALNIVMNANFRKLGASKDEHGKQLKPEGWTGPEAELQALLDKRGN